MIKQLQFKSDLVWLRKLYSTQQNIYTYINIYVESIYSVREERMRYANTKRAKKRKKEVKDGGHLLLIAMNVRMYGWQQQKNKKECFNH